MDRITRENYTAAVARLILTAQGDTSGSRVSALVLLSAYNGEAFQLNIVDLCNLDSDHYRAALVVIRGRVELGIEPQTLIKNGTTIFEKLWNQWQHYHIDNRGRKDSEKTEVVKK